MRGLQIAQFGVFLLILGYSVLLFSFVLIAIWALSNLLTDSEFLADLSLKLAMWGVPSILLGTAVVGLGKILCAGAPEEGARKLIVISLVADLMIFVVRFTVNDFLVRAIIAGILSLISFVCFCQFLTRMGDNVGEPRVGQYAALMYAGLGGSSFVWFFAFFNFYAALLLALGILALTILLYQYTCYTLFRALPIYIAEVKAGITDPTESGETRRELERKERLHGPSGGGGNQSKPPEEPRGTPPDGHLLYRVPKGLEPLHLAVKEGDRYKVELRLAQGDDPRKPVKHKLSPLHLAASVGVMDVADALLKAGAPIDDVCEMGLTPLYFSVQTGNTNIAGFLLDRGANIFHKNEQGYTPLHWACSAPHPNFIGPVRVKMVTFLISKGADYNAVTNQGKTPRDLALENQLEETIGVLDRHMGIAPKPTGIVVDKVEKPEQVVPAAFPPFLGLDLCVLPKDLTALHAAVKEGDPEKVQAQLHGGARIEDRVAGGIAPIHITAITGVMSVTETLLRYGAPVDQPFDHNLTSVFLAVYLNNYNMVGYLISKGAKANHQDALGRTPLHWAAAAPSERLEGQNRIKMVQLLLDNGADPKIADNNGQTPQDLARAAELDDVVKLFVDEEDSSSSKGDDDGYYT